MSHPSDAVLRAGRATVFTLFSEQTRRSGDALALVFGTREWTYRDLDQAVERMAAGLRAHDVKAGDRIAVLSENCPEYLMVHLAAAKLGAIVACLNWRLTAAERHYCIALVEPVLLITSTRYAGDLGASENAALPTTSFEDLLHRSVDAPGVASPDVDPESGLLILYTSGTTGHPKAALISHRAEISRMCVLRMDLGLAATDAYIAWSPMFHMGGTEHSLATLMSGGTVVVIDGMDAGRIADALARFQVGWLLLIPAGIEPVLQQLRARRITPRGVRVVGCMADLVPRALIAETTRLLGAPFLNSFGSTETGLPPATADLIPIGVLPEVLSKRLSSLCEHQIVDANGNGVPIGDTGEMLVRGPTLFSGYWNAESVNRQDFRDGWFRMGDLFQQTRDGRLNFVGRAKYLIKSGGENIYPAEIERVLLADPRILDASVVRKPDSRWGEVPVAVIARREASLTSDDVRDLCRTHLAGYKCPKQILFVAPERLERNVTGKIQRDVLEKLALETPLETADV